MSIENLQESERKMKEKTEEERKLEIAQEIERRYEKERLFEIFEKDKKLAFLKAMIERGFITPSTAEAILSGEELDIREIEEIFQKIEDIENTKDIEKILPKDLRITRDEYVGALCKADARQVLLTKIDTSLIHIHDLVHPQGFSVLDMFSSFITILNRNLVKVQENTIDIKRSLTK